jgi:hypothetical protein
MSTRKRKGATKTPAFVARAERAFARVARKLRVEWSRWGSSDIDEARRVRERVRTNGARGSGATWTMQSIGRSPKSGEIESIKVVVLDWLPASFLPKSHKPQKGEERVSIVSSDPYLHFFSHLPERDWRAGGEHLRVRAASQSTPGMNRFTRLAYSS